MNNICILYYVKITMYLKLIKKKYVHYTRGRACKVCFSIPFICVLINKIRQDQIIFITPTNVLLRASYSSIYQHTTPYVATRYCQTIRCYCLSIIPQPKKKYPRSQLSTPLHSSHIMPLQYELDKGIRNYVRGAKQRLPVY